MKIEKISNSQIRCILTGEDLASRQLRLSELAYGSEKARALFRDTSPKLTIRMNWTPAFQTLPLPCRRTLFLRRSLLPPWLSF